MRTSTIYIYVSLIIFFALTLLSCDKNNNDQRIPYVTVNITIHTSDPEFIKLNSVGGWTYITGGSRGIIVYRKSNDEFMAFDRHTPYNVDKSCSFASVESSTNTTAKEDCAGSQYLLSDGSVIGGPAVYPLHRYQTSFDGKVLKITN